MGDVFLTSKPGHLPTSIVYEDGSIVVVHNTPVNRAAPPSAAAGARTPFSALAIDAAGERLVSCDAAGNVVLYDLVAQTFRRVRNVSLPAAHLAFSARDARLLYAVTDATLRVYALDTGDMVASLEGHRGDIGALTQTADGGTLLTVSTDVAVMWDTGTWARKRSMGGAQGGVAHAAIAAAARLLIVAFRDDSVIVWDLATFEVLAKLSLSEPEAGAGLLSLHAAEDGSMVAATAANGCCYVWDLPSQQLVRIIDPPAPATSILQVAVVSSAALAAQAALLSSADGGGARCSAPPPPPQLAMLDDAGRFLLVELGPTVIAAVLELEAPPVSVTRMPEGGGEGEGEGGLVSHRSATSLTKPRIASFGLSQDARLLGLLVDDGRLFAYDVPQAKAFRLEALSLKGASLYGGEGGGDVGSGAGAMASGGGGAAQGSGHQQGGTVMVSDAGPHNVLQEMQHLAAEMGIDYGVQEQALPGGRDDDGGGGEAQHGKEEQEEEGGGAEEDLSRTGARGSKMLATLTAAGVASGGGVSGSASRWRGPARRLPPPGQLFHGVPPPHQDPEVRDEGVQVDGNVARAGSTLVDHTYGAGEGGGLSSLVGGGGGTLQHYAQQGQVQRELDAELKEIKEATRRAAAAATEASRVLDTPSDPVFREGDVVGLAEGRRVAPTGGVRRQGGAGTLDIAGQPLHQLAAAAAMMRPFLAAELPAGVSPHQASILNAASTHRRLKAVLDKKGRLPPKQRQAAWKFLLRLPSNTSAYRALLSRGPHPAWADLHIRYPVKDGLTLSRLSTTLSALAWWSPVFGQTPYLPALVFPFVKYYGSNPGGASEGPVDDLAMFETALSVILCWARAFVETLPHPPLALLSRVHTLLLAVDAPLATHLQALGVDPIRYAWPLLRSALSEVLDRAGWEVLWDHLFTAGHDPSLLIYAVVAFLRQVRSPLLEVPRPDVVGGRGAAAAALTPEARLSSPSVHAVSLIVRNQTAVDLPALLKCMYDMRRGVKAEAQPYPLSEGEALAAQGATHDPYLRPALNERGRVAGSPHLVPAETRSASATGIPGNAGPTSGDNPALMRGDGARPFFGPAFPLPRSDAYPTFTAAFPRGAVEDAASIRARIAQEERELLAKRAAQEERGARAAALATQEAAWRLQREMAAVEDAGLARAEKVTLAVQAREGALLARMEAEQRVRAARAMEESALSELQLHQLEMVALLERSEVEASRAGLEASLSHAGPDADGLLRAEREAAARLEELRRQMRGEEARLSALGRVKVAGAAGVRTTTDGYSSPLRASVAGPYGASTSTSVVVNSQPAQPPQPPAHATGSHVPHASGAPSRASSAGAPSASPPHLVVGSRAGGGGGAPTGQTVAASHAAASSHLYGLDHATKAAYEAAAALTASLVASEGERLRSEMAGQAVYREEMSQVAEVRKRLALARTAEKMHGTSGSLVDSAYGGGGSPPRPWNAVANVPAPPVHHPSTSSPASRGAYVPPGASPGRGRGPLVDAVHPSGRGGAPLPPRSLGSAPGLAFGSVAGGAMAPTPSLGSRPRPTDTAGGLDGSTVYTVDAVVHLQHGESGSEGGWGGMELGDLRR